MKYPKFLYNKTVKVTGIKLGEDGEETFPIYEGQCTYNEESKDIYNADKQLITLSGSIVIAGDIYPNNVIKGYVEVDGTKKTIVRTSRPKTPDGTVFSTELDLA
ncbi:hypothetical protein [Clostridium beijerinckii]|uniref:hypothetical protein n=1 Tax=Clostridium beijerinckii TaxID=1520 RepID=UPI00047951F7|nr:hypothetical protein [Clostridium beijerinckii]